MKVAKALKEMVFLMSDIEKVGSLYLGKTYNTKLKKVEDKPLLYDSKNLTTHAVCVGMTGSGKTGLGIALLEEIALSKIPALIVDPKGDLGNLLLTFPKLLPSDFLPWLEKADADRKNLSLEQYADLISKNWKEGLKEWGEDTQRIQKMRDSCDLTIYTPASRSGVSISILNSFDHPPDELLKEPQALRDRVQSVTSGLLGLLGIDADPLKSREHILISLIINSAWEKKRDLDLAGLIREIQAPPFDKVGVLDLESFFPTKERASLAVSLNNLLASPGFQAWGEGEPLDMQNLLYTKEGRPRLAIITLSHLSDSERMFFVTLLLNELLGWIRRQTGTSNLRALLYMDEIFGYFPPTSMPPSKLPMLTLLKQARAFGLGIVLATQNPVDLDYKGLSNCGTWFIGKLQTDRDKERVMQGLEMSSSASNELLNSLGNRVFLLRSSQEDAPLLFQTRWTLSYLKGPLTLPQINTLMGSRLSAPSSKKEASKLKSSPPIGINEYYLIPKNATTTPQSFIPMVLGRAKLHFVDTKMKIDEWQEIQLVAPAMDGSVDWEKGQKINTENFILSKASPEGGNFEEIPSSLMQAKNYPLFNKSYFDFLYQNKTLDYFVSPDKKIFSKLGESEEEFRSRLTQSQGQNKEVDKIRDRYNVKISAIEEKIQRAQTKIETQKTQAGQKKMEAYISAGTTLLGALFGKGLTKGSISKAGTSIGKITKVSKDEERVGLSVESLESLQQQLQDIQIERDKEIAQLLTGATSQVQLEKVLIRPRKSDISVEEISLIWCPKI